MSDEIAELEHLLIFKAQKFMKRTVLGLMSDLMERTNKDTGEATAGWKMSEGDGSGYVPPHHKDAEGIKKTNTAQDSRYVDLQRQHAQEAVSICSDENNVNKITIENNVEHVKYINEKWNPFFFESAINDAKATAEGLKRND